MESGSLLTNGYFLLSLFLVIVIIIGWYYHTQLVAEYEKLKILLRDEYEKYGGEHMTRDHGRIYNGVRYITDGHELSDDLPFSVNEEIPSLAQSIY